MLQHQHSKDRCTKGHGTCCFMNAMGRNQRQVAKARDGDKGEMNHIDPVDGGVIEPGKAYAEKDGLAFRSLETQQMFYHLLDNGFEVVRSLEGRPRLRKRQGNAVWSYEKRLLWKKSDDATIELEPGHYELHAELSRGDGSGKSELVNRQAMVKVEGLVKDVCDFALELKPSTPMLKTRFAIEPNQLHPRKSLELKISKSNRNPFVSKLKLVLVRVSDPLAVREEYDRLREKTEAMIGSENEYLVELRKRSIKGFGLQVGWSEPLSSTVIVNVDPDVPSLCGPGDLILAVQGERIQEPMSLLRHFRNEPRKLYILVKELGQAEKDQALATMTPLDLGALPKRKSLADFIPPPNREAFTSDKSAMQSTVESNLEKPRQKQQEGQSRVVRSYQLPPPPTRPSFGKQKHENESEPDPETLPQEQARPDTGSCNPLGTSKPSPLEQAESATPPPPFPPRPSSRS